MQGALRGAGVGECAPQWRLGHAGTQGRDTPVARRQAHRAGTPLWHADKGGHGELSNLGALEGGCLVWQV